MSAPTWDYEHAYPGGPMVGPPLPHPSYPPDAAPGHTPTKNSPTHKAYKRALCRGGRWGEWNPNNWDEAFSNAFSHGKTGGNVFDSGIAGFQRQMKIQPTGWVGESTYNAMRSARIPVGLPNSGQPLFDSVCVDLLEQGSQEFEQPSKPPKTIRQLALAESVRQIGTKESPFGSNRCKFTQWYGMVGPWCAMFATYCFETAAQNVGKDSPSFVGGMYYAYVPYILNDARAQMRGLSLTSSPIPGDLVLYDWNRNGVPDHVGIFESGNSSSWVAIEGNTSMGNDSNGGEVMRRNRNISRGLITFVRVAEPK
jgi:CHAP domain